MIYLDNAATTQPDPAVIDTFCKVNESFWANPHSLHRIGERAEQLLEQARDQVTVLLGGEQHFRTIFTSGATESNNLAIRGIAELHRARGNHLITTNVEHPSVAEVMNHLEQQGFRVNRLPVNTNGTVSVDQVREAITGDTILVSIMMVNNESGAINPIGEIGELLRSHRALFHVDAVQGIGKIPVMLNEMAIDLLSLSAHKFFGLKGSGALILRKNQTLAPLIIGGGQEFNLRSGTADVPRAAALAKALRLATDSIPDRLKQAERHNLRLRSAITAIENITINSPTNGSPYILNCSIEGIRPETLLHGLAKAEIFVSTVSACSSQKANLSEVILAMTGDEKRAASTLRISLSHKTTDQEIAEFCRIFPETVRSLR